MQRLRKRLRDWYYLTVAGLMIDATLLYLVFGTILWFVIWYTT